MKSVCLKDLQLISRPADGDSYGCKRLGPTEDCGKTAFAIDL